MISLTHILMFTILILLGTSVISANQRIVGGPTPGIRQFPWHVHLKGHTLEGDYFCGGALISSRWVLTAAQCVAIDNLQQINVELGGSDIGKPLVKAVADDIIIHNRFNKTFLNYDIALIKLDKDVPFSDYISPISLNTDPISIGATLFVSGHGLTDPLDDQSVSKKLRFARVYVVDPQECYSAYQNKIGPHILCARGHGGQSHCMGDSGGALIVADNYDPPLHVGIVSSADPSGCNKGVLIYTETAPFREWIKEISGV